MRACLICGEESPDVRVALVEVAKPERLVDVTLLNHPDVTVRVPERFYAIPRCRDEGACRLRELTAQAGPPTPAEAMEDPARWL